jgi:hypothetical protein
LSKTADCFSSHVFSSFSITHFFFLKHRLLHRASPGSASRHASVSLLWSFWLFLSAQRIIQPLRQHTATDSPHGCHIYPTCFFSSFVLLFRAVCSTISVHSSVCMWDDVCTRLPTGQRVFHRRPVLFFRQGIVSFLGFQYTESRPSLFLFSHEAGQSARVQDETARPSWRENPSRLTRSSLHGSLVWNAGASVCLRNRSRSAVEAGRLSRIRRTRVRSGHLLIPPEARVETDIPSDQLPFVGLMHFSAGAVILVAL